MKTLSKICLDALNLARKTAYDLGESGRKPVPTKKDEPVTKSDLEISKALKKYFLNSNLNAIYVSEEAGQMNSRENPTHAVYFDELDGTFNWQRGSLFSSSTVIAAFDYKDSSDIRFKDAVFAGVLDLNLGNLWYAERGCGSFFNNTKSHPSGRRNLGKDVFSIVDYGPCPSESEVAQLARVLESTWQHNISCAGIHLAGVASGHFDVAVLPAQKAHELGAGYLLVKEAGRYIVDFQGKSLDEQIFDFGKKYQIVAADTKELGEKVLKKIKR